MKKLKTALLLAFFGMFSALNAQCPVGDVNLYYQADIDNYAIAFPDCDFFEGNLALGKTGIVSDIHDLSPLSMIKGIGGSLIIYGAPNLTNLDGLHNIEYVGKDVSFSNNPALNSLQGLKNLAIVGGSFQIGNQPAIISLAGLEKLESIGKDLFLSYTPNLASLQGLSALTSIGGSLILDHNQGIASLEGLNNLTSVGYDVLIIDNAALGRLDGLENLLTIGRNLYIGRQFTDGTVGNPALVNIEALNGLETIGAQLTIAANPLLSACNVDFVCDFLSKGGPAIIIDNAPECESLAIVMEACGLTSVREIDPASIRIRPNPAVEWMGIDSPFPLEYLAIFNAQGRLVYESQVAVDRVDVSAFAKGMYVVRMKIQGSEFVQRLIVQ
jgi:hypothetical protein